MTSTSTGPLNQSPPKNPSTHPTPPQVQLPPVLPTAPRNENFEHSIDFKDGSVPSIEQTVADVREKLSTALQALGVLAKDKDGLRTLPGTETEPSVDFSFPMPGIGKLMGQIRQGGELTFQTLPDSTKVFSVSYGDKQFLEKDGDLVEAGENRDLFIKDPNTGDIYLVTHQVENVDGKTVLQVQHEEKSKDDTINGRPATVVVSKPADNEPSSRVVVKLSPEAKPEFLHGAAATELAGALAKENPELLSTLQRVYPGVQPSPDRN